jgi:hypothetical protein
MRLQKETKPWTYWIADNFLSAECLAELKSVNRQSTQQDPGQRVGSDRFFITDKHQHEYPELFNLYQRLDTGDLKQFFSEQTGVNYSELYLRVEVVSDYGEFYLEPHHDHLEKRLSAIVYTDHAQLWPGTTITGHGAIESQDNRCFFFVPSEETYHEYPKTNFTSVRRCLMINYWTYE